MNRLGVKEIEQILPHRHPFLLVDYIEDYEPGKFAIGYKCVTFREDFFKGHFPQEPGHAGSPDGGSTCTDRCCGNLESRRKQRQDCIFWRNQKLQISRKSCSGRQAPSGNNDYQMQRTGWRRPCGCKR